MTTHFGEFTIWPSGEMYMTTGTRRKATAAAPIPDVVEHIKQQIIETVGDDHLQVQRGRGGTITLKYEAEIADEAPAAVDDTPAQEARPPDDPDSTVILVDGACNDTYAHVAVGLLFEDVRDLRSNGALPSTELESKTEREALRKQGIYPY